MDIREKLSKGKSSNFHLERRRSSSRKRKYSRSSSSRSRSRSRSKDSRYHAPKRSRHRSRSKHRYRGRRSRSRSSTRKDYSGSRYAKKRRRYSSSSSSSCGERRKTFPSKGLEKKKSDFEADYTSSSPSPPRYDDHKQKAAGVSRSQASIFLSGKSIEILPSLIASVNTQIDPRNFL